MADQFCSVCQMRLGKPSWRGMHFECAFGDLVGQGVDRYGHVGLSLRMVGTLLVLTAVAQLVWWAFTGFPF